MALLKLEDIGKIYVSDGNVSVGIRGVDLSFERGEFVAITGQSGSGKSTLLNVISGMDTYEEGEMYIEGQPTSHYMQPEWEEYRKNYISFIFQDYNIIESFTVLENVELALMHVEDKRERRKCALNLLEKVGLSAYVKQKGSKLSGGQKQRTVIARALAKDSPIILADEPTGNLDSQTSKEIIELLREVSKDKLLIVVTHNFEQVEEYATRHIRVFDGAVEFDHAMAEPRVGEITVKSAVRPKKKKHENIKNGFVLGWAIFKSKPKLSAFLCILMIVATLGMFSVTSLSGDAKSVFEKHYMFTHIDGRVVLTEQNGEVLSEERVKSLADEYGAQSYVKYDILLDKSSDIEGVFLDGDKKKSVNFNCTFGEDFGDDIVGRYPTAENEVFLYIPISYRNIFGEDSIRTDSIFINSLKMTVTGVKYYIDNNITPKCLYTEDGFRSATAVYYLKRGGSSVMLQFISENGSIGNYVQYDSFTPSYEVEEGKIYLPSSEYAKYGGEPRIDINSFLHKYDANNPSNSQTLQFNEKFGKEYFSEKKPSVTALELGDESGKTVYISPTLLRSFAEDVLADSYRQTSLFFENDAEAAVAAKKLNENGYIAVMSNTTYTPDAITTIISIAAGVLSIVMWLLAIVFLAFFVNLCSGRTIGAFKGEMAIMRSMGIPVKVIRVGTYVRMLIALVPAYLFVILTSILIYTTPTFNKFFTYLYPWQYVLMFVGMLMLTLRVTHKQIKRLFGESVKKSLKGGASND